MGRFTLCLLLVGILAISYVHAKHHNKCKDDSLHPHEKSCKHFYKCNKGKLVQMSCPKNLEFNPTLKVCDWPENAGCKLGGSDSSSSSESDSSESSESNESNEGYPPPRPPRPTSKPETNYPHKPCYRVPKPKCPNRQPASALHLPHQSDCRQFYKCDFDQMYLETCPGGLHFNAALQVCDWPEKAGCACARN